jgi:hypothetical protein
MLEVTIPSNNFPERAYAISIILADMLGIDYHIKISTTASDYTLRWADKSIVFRDAFFSSFVSVQK